MSRPVQLPKSRVATGFHIVGALWLVLSIIPAIFSGWFGVGMFGTSPKLGSLFSVVTVQLILQPILIILFGSVVQMIADIRWKLLNDGEMTDA